MEQRPNNIRVHGSSYLDEYIRRVSCKRIIIYYDPSKVITTCESCNFIRST